MFSRYVISFDNKNVVIIRLKVIGISIFKLSIDMLYIYVSYRLNSDKSTVDEIPGIMVDIDKSVPIRKEFNSGNEFVLQFMFCGFMNNINIPMVKVIKKGIKYLFLNPFFVLSFNKFGIVPKRKPVNIIYVSFG